MVTDEDVSVFELDLREAVWRWFYVARRFETPEQAREAFERINAHANRLQGKAGLAGYRLLDDLTDKGGVPRIVVIIGAGEERVREAARMLDGEKHDMPPDQVRGLVFRRLRFLLAAGQLGATPGVHLFQHEHGMRLDDRGNVVPMED